MRLPRPAAVLPLTAALAAALAAAAGAQSQPLPPGVTAMGLTRGWREASGAHTAAIEIRLAPGWHTYWRVPGETGIPPQFDWSGSRNLAAVAYEWPRPQVFDSYGIPTIGYKKALTLPVRLTPETAGAPIEAVVDVTFGVCDDICIPAQARLSARLEPHAPAVGRLEIERALADRPMAAAAGVAAARCALSADGAGHRLTAEIDFAAPQGPGLSVVIEADSRPDLWIGEAATAVDGRRVTATAAVDTLTGGGVAIDRDGLRLTVLDAERAIDIRGCPAG